METITTNFDGYSLTELDTYAVKLRALRDDYRTAGNDDMAGSVQATMDAIRDEIQNRLTALVRST